MQGQTKEQLLDALSGKSEAIFEKGLKDLKANKDVVCFDECKLDYDRITKLVDVIPSRNNFVQHTLYEVIRIERVMKAILKALPVVCWGNGAMVKAI